MCFHLQKVRRRQQSQYAPCLDPYESAVINFLNKIDQLRVCPGQPDKHFVELVQKRKGCIKAADGTLVASVDNHGMVELNGEKFDQLGWLNVTY